LQLTQGAISHSAEILEAKYVTDFSVLKLSSITKEIIESLVIDGYIKLLGD